MVVELPDPGVGLVVAALDRGDRDVDGLDVLGVEVVVPGGRGEQQQRLTERVELELGVDVVADDVGAAGIAGQVQRALVGNAVAVDRVRGRQVRPVGEQPLGDERDGVVQQRVRGVGGDCLPRVALVADPHVAVVVVAAPLRPLGQAHRGRGDHPTPALVSPRSTA